jgi:hypothetical protein
MALHAIGDRFRASFRRWMGRGQAQSTARPQSNEAVLLEGLLRNLRVPKVFCEFGFDAREFNCAGLAEAGWRGLLIDSDTAKVAEAQRAFRSTARDITVRCLLLDRENVRPAIASYSAPGELGVLSVDVDGNDYWLLRELFALAPALIVCEYNASFLLHSVTVPYDPVFDRHAHHKLGFYHGASLSALTTLAAAHAYDLVAVSEAGLNAVFRRHDLDPEAKPLNVSEAYRENAFRNKWHGLTAQEQWDSVRHLPLVWT